MNYLIFFLFLVGSFVMADEGSLGTVRILNSQLARYNPQTRQVIPQSMHMILNIKGVQFDRVGDVDLVILSTSEDGLYDAFVILFDHSRGGSLGFQKYLSRNKKFIIDVSADDVKFDATHFYSNLVASADTLKIKDRQLARATSLKNVVCPLTTENGWLPWIGHRSVRANCL